MKTPKLQTTERLILIAKAKDRALRFFNAVRHYRKAQEIYFASIDEGEFEESKDKELSKKARGLFNLPENVCIDRDEYAQYNSTLKTIDAALKKIINQRIKAEEIGDLIWTCEECDEIDLGWVIFERPFGYYEYEIDPFWNDRCIYEVLCIIAGLKESADHEAILFALQNPPSSATKPRTISSAMDSIASGGDAMEAIRELLGDQLTTSF